MTTLSITKLYDLLAGKWGKETAENLTNFIDNKINQGLESKTSIFATKEDIAKLDAKIGDTKSELIKWMFLFWTAQMAATYGFILLFIKK